MAQRQLAFRPDPAESEVEAYRFILNRLKEIGWVVRNPERHTGGQVWTQGQCLSHPEIKRTLGLTKPENIVKLAETKLWVIEAKSKRTQIGKALREAENDYARKIAVGGVLAVPLITGRRRQRRQRLRRRGPGCWSAAGTRRSRSTACQRPASSTRRRSPPSSSPARRTSPTSK